MNGSPPKNRQVVYAIIRHDPRSQDYPFTVKEIVYSFELAQAEVNRLNELKAGKHSFYSWQYTRLYPPGRSAGTEESGLKPD